MGSNDHKESEERIDRIPKGEGGHIAYFWDVVMSYFSAWVLNIEESILFFFKL